MTNLRKILERLIKRGMKPSEQADYCEIIKKDVDQAIQEILALLPKKMKHTEKEILQFNNNTNIERNIIGITWTYKNGWNACIDNITEALNG